MRKTVCVVIAVMLVLAAIGVLLVGASGCDRGLRLGDEDSGGRVSLAVGETLELVLTSNPTTGYSWSMVGLPDCLEQEGESEYDSDAPPGMMGAGGEETWRFTAVEPGEGTLVLEYTRPWESDEPTPVETFEVEVVVE